MTDDAELLRRYVDSHSETDFTVLVERHVNVVYQAALRRSAGRTDLAQDVTQQVFTTLAREAPKLVSHPALAGWLFTATRHAADHLLRTERRRLDRETQAVMTSFLEDFENDADWDQVRFQLDEVMDKLAEQDRAAILLRYFHNQPFAEIGRVFGLSEDTARKRVERALERLRGLFARRGITSTTLALGVMLSGHAASAAPAGLAHTIASAALLPGATASVPASGLFYFMNTKIALSITGALGLAGLLSLPPLGLALYEVNEATRARLTVASARQENEHRVGELSKLHEQGRQAADRTSALRGELDRVQAAVTAITKRVQQASSSSQNSKVDPEALSDGEKFLARFDQARQMLSELGRAQVHAGFIGFYRSAGLTSDQIQEIDNRTAECWIKGIAVTPGAMYPTVFQLPDDQMLQILGAENFRRFQEFNRTRSAYMITGRAELAAGNIATPLSAHQSEQLVQAIIANSSDGQSTQSLKIESVNWEKTAAQAQTFLTPEQWKATQPVLLDAQFQTAIEKAQLETPAAETQKT